MFKTRLTHLTVASLVMVLTLVAMPATPATAVSTFGASSLVVDNTSAAATQVGIDLQPAVTASSAVAYGTRLQQTLTASANNDALTALYINPTFADGAFTGVTHNGLIVASGRVSFGTTTPTAPFYVLTTEANASSFYFRTTDTTAAERRMVFQSDYGFPRFMFIRGVGLPNTSPALSSNDEFGDVQARGTKDTASGVNSAIGTASMKFRTTENWTTTATGSRIVFLATPTGTTTPVEIMTAHGSGVGINTSTPTEKLDINSDNLRVRTPKTPASATDTCDQGEIAWDVGFVYVCTATNTWKRSAIATW